MVISLVADLFGAIEILAKTIHCHVEACRQLPAECSQIFDSAMAVADMIRGLPQDTTSKATVRRLHGLLTEVSDLIHKLAAEASESDANKGNGLLRRTLRRLSVGGKQMASAVNNMKKLKELSDAIDSELLRLTQAIEIARAKRRPASNIDALWAQEVSLGEL